MGQINHITIRVLIKVSDQAKDINAGLVCMQMNNFYNTDKKENQDLCRISFCIVCSSQLKFPLKNFCQYLPIKEIHSFQTKRAYCLLAGRRLHCRLSICSDFGRLRRAGLSSGEVTIILSTFSLGQWGLYYFRFHLRLAHSGLLNLEHF